MKRNPHAFDAAIPASKVRALAEKWKNSPGWRGLGEALEAHLLRDLDAPCETCGGTKLVPCGCFDKKNCQHIRGLRGCPTCGGAS